MSHCLPAPETDEAFHDVDGETDYTPALLRIAALAGIDARLGREGAPARFEDGSLPVFAMGGRVVKLYPPSCASAYRNERSTLEHIVHVEGALPIPTPRVEAHGAIDGWHFIVMTRIAGRPLRACASALSSSDRLRLARELGSAVAHLHHLPTDGLPTRDWGATLAAQRAGCVARQRRLGLDEAWLAQIDPFLDDVMPEIDARRRERREVLLHTEIMREHVFVSEREGRFELSGLLDFEPSRVGPAEYELASVGLFFAEGDGAIFGAFLDGLGVPPSERGVALARRCMAWALLHRYANLRWWLERLPSGAGCGSFEELAPVWFADGS